MIPFMQKRQKTGTPLVVVLSFCAAGFAAAALLPLPGTIALAQDVSAIAKGKGLLDLPGTKASIEEMQRKLDLYTLEYKRRLSTARTKAVSDTDVEDVQRIDKAMNGGYVAQYSSKAAQEARKYYDDRLAELTKSLLSDLNRDVKAMLTSGQTDNAATTKAVIDFLSAYNSQLDKASKSDSKQQTSFTVDADKDWQPTGVTIKNPAHIWIDAQGRWAPGWGGAARNKPSMADADTYPLQLRLSNGEGVKTGGTKWDFTIDRGGELEARMRPANRAQLSEARGKLTVRIAWKESEEKSGPAADPLEKVLYDLTVSSQPAAEAKAAVTPPAATAATSTTTATAPQTASLILKATDETIKTGVVVNAGDKIKLTALGEWTPNKDKNPPSSADIHNYVATIDKTLLGRFGKEIEVTASASGEICLRPQFSSWSKQRSYTPAGNLKISITVTPGGAAAPTPGK